MDGGSSTPVQSTATDLPPWAQGYAKSALEKASALAEKPYEAYGANRIAGFSPMQLQAQQSAAGMAAGPEAFSQGIGAYMSPYMQNVVDIQKREARRQADISGQQIGAKAAMQGAYGGARQGIENASLNRELMQQMGDIQARGTQAAYDQASNQFRQGITQGMDINRLQNAYGGQQQALEQQGLTQAYGDWQNQQNYPYKQVGFFADMIRGLPVGQNTTTYGQSPSPFNAVAGIGALSKYFAEGGAVGSAGLHELALSRMREQA